MQITIISSKTGESHVCSKSEAARILGVCSKTILRWSKKLLLNPNHIEQFNNFSISFKTNIYKQPKGKYPRKHIKIV